jgi:hypothetical protein
MMRIPEDEQTDGETFRVNTPIQAKVSLFAVQRVRCLMSRASAADLSSRYGLPDFY